MTYLYLEEIRIPDMRTRPCCYNCAHVAPDTSILDRRTWCRKHRRVTFPGWWCSDHVTPEELELRELALQNLEVVGSNTQATLPHSLAVGDIESRRQEETQV